MKRILRKFLPQSGLDLVKYSLLLALVALVSYYYGSCWQFYRHMGHLQ